MTKNKKLLITIACLTVILCSLVTGTIAWLTAETPSITNTFAPSNIGLTLSETTGNSYKMVPGETIIKNPVVTVSANSEACYVFVKIDENLGAWTGNFKDYLAYTVASDWIPLADVNGVYYVELDQDTAAAGESYPVLKDNAITVSHENVTKEMMAKLYDASGNLVADLPKLTFTAYAIQSENLTDKDGDSDVDAKDAWTLLNQ